MAKRDSQGDYWPESYSAEDGWYRLTDYPVTLEKAKEYADMFQDYDTKTRVISVNGIIVK